MGDLISRRRPPRILVVDDQPSIAGLMSQLLTMRGYDVTTASNAEQAEAEVRKQLPDLILSDVMMPGKSGYDFCRGLKENPATRLIPFVLITGLSDSSDKVRGIEAGADDFLNKPVLAEELIALVKSLLRLKEFTDELETADSVLCTLGLIVEGRDPYTEGHCERLAMRAADMGRHLGMDEDSVLALKRGGYLHDLGKIAVPDEILKKGSDLTAEEWAIMKLHPVTGELWADEHGPQGGDELNLVRAGKNYGWPVITYGAEYVTGAKIGEGTAKAGMEQPLTYWVPSIATSGLAFLTSDRYPGWKGNAFIGALKAKLLVRLELDGAKVVREERLLQDLGERIRDVRQGPDGWLYLLTDSPEGRILRLER